MTPKCKPEKQGTQVGQYFMDGYVDVYTHLESSAIIVCYLVVEKVKTPTDSI